VSCGTEKDCLSLSSVRFAHYNQVSKLDRLVDECLRLCLKNGGVYSSLLNIILNYAVEQSLRYTCEEIMEGLITCY
jgi:hypothetical protein